MTNEQIEKAKNDYAQSIIDSFGRSGVPCGISDIRSMIADGFKAGATEALASQWKDPKVELPEDGEYVLISTDRGIEPSVWNEHHQCWDDAEGDDYMYSMDYVEAWMSIPPLKGGDE